MISKAGDARVAVADVPVEMAWDRARDKVLRAEALGQATAQLNAESLEDRFASLEKQEEIEKMLEELKSQRKAG